jgi:UDP-2,3-diacylglucosamine pyrophosphatase LpxH
MPRPLHTFVLSDIHLADAELGVPGKSLWKRYKRPKFFIDQSFKRLLEFLETETKGAPCELIFNGDIFDFDSVMRLPLHTSLHLSWLEKKRGLYPEEEKSRFKMEVILSDHPVFVHAVRDFIQRGNSVVFIVGNHDIELHWPAVQREVLKALGLSPEEETRVRFCEFFYVSNGDTAVEHGNQYDDYCVSSNPIHPFIRKGKRIQVRLPFGNIAGRYMTNGMGLFNPHVESSFLMDLPEYFRFFYKYAIRVQPLIGFTWLWGACVSFWVAITDGLLPAMRDPLFVEQRVQEVAEKANATPEIVRTMVELKVHSAIFNPVKIARELWLDRFMILALIGFLSFQIYAVIYLIFPISKFWFVFFFLLLVPGLIFYSRNIKSVVVETMEEIFKNAPMVAKITKTRRVVFGHTHRELHTSVDQIEVINTGTWSPAFKDPECRESFGKKCFAWIRYPDGDLTREREAELFEWNDPELVKIPVRK